MAEQTEKITSSNYGQKAVEYAKKAGIKSFPMISPGMPEWTAWARYYAHLGEAPWAFENTRKGKAKFYTVPTQWPEWFDPDYAGGSNGQP